MLRLLPYLLVLYCVPLLSNFKLDPARAKLLDRVWMPRGNYYGITINGKTYRGDRVWEERWAILKDAVDYRGLRVLDLGTFYGLAPTCIKKYCGAKSATGVDFHYIRQAKVVSKAFQADVKYIQTHLDNDPGYEEKIGNNYDIVLCMSLYNWIKDKTRLMNYLAQFDRIIYEGHDPDEVEIQRFQTYGYRHKILGVSYSGKHLWSKRGRTLILFYR